MLREKLHSNRGASILLALLYLLVCVFIGAVALGSATTSAQKVQEREADQQTYLAVSSAARLLRDAMGADVCEAVEKKTVCSYDGGCSSEEPPWLETTAETFPIDGTVADVLTEAAWTICKADTHYVEPAGSAPYETEFTVAVDGLPSVHCEMTMNGDYDVTVLLRPLGEDGAELDTHNMTLTFEASAVEKEDKPIVACPHQTGINPETGAPIFDSFNRTEYIYTTTITWPAVTIAKGVAADAP